MTQSSRDIRGPVIRALAEAPGERLHRRFEDPSDGGLWLFECVRDGGEWWTVRQVAPSPQGLCAYDWRNLEDEHGFLTDQPVPDDAPGEAITQDEFDRVWAEVVAARDTD